MTTEAEKPVYFLSEIATCMRLAAHMLNIADQESPIISKANKGQAQLLWAAAEDIERRDRIEHGQRADCHAGLAARGT